MVEGGIAMINKVGEIHRDLQILEELGGNKVRCKCIKCNHIDIYIKGALIKDKLICKNCGRNAGQIGEIHRGLQIIKDLGKNEVTCKCLKCGHTDSYTKGNLLADRLVCKNRCEINIRKDHTGEIHKSLLIVKELGKSIVLCKCINCGNTDEYTKNTVIQDRILCKNCGTNEVGKMKDRKGEIFRGLEILEELGNGAVKCKCAICGVIDNYGKQALINSKLICKNCKGDRKKGKIISKLGEIYNGLEIVAELGGGKVSCKCTKCEHTDIYSKSDLQQYNLNCKKCGKKYKDRTGEIYNGLKIIEELGGNRVKCKCVDCGHISENSKGDLTCNKYVCKNCSLKENYRGNKINNIKVIDFEYTGRDKQRYYKCLCDKCKEELILTREEMIEYNCNKEQ